MSNIKIWRDHVNDRNAFENDFVVVFEGDVWFVNENTILQDWKLMYGNIIDDTRWNWLYLGFSSNSQSLLYGDVGVAPGIQRFSNVRRSFGGGTFGYAIRKRGARFLLDKAKQFGISQAIDWFMMDTGMGGAMPGMSPYSVYKLSPLLVITTPVLQLNVSDTTQNYPADLRADEASKWLLKAKANKTCRSIEPSISVPSSSTSSAIPMRIFVSPAPVIVTRPSFRWKMELELTVQNIDGNEMIQQHLETWHRNRSHDQLNQFKVGDKIPVSVPSSIWSDAEPYVSRFTSISGMEIYVINDAVPKQIASEWDLELRHAT
jgi:GR25 family glycosyltransferase involved in LPS biosynthesis